MIQITIDNQQVRLDALQVVTLAVKQVVSGITIDGNKPFAAYSGNICADIQPDYFVDYVVVINIFR